MDQDQNKYQQIIQNLKSEFETQEEVIAFFVTGSVARGDADEYSDLDLILVTKEAKPFEEFERGGVTVEIKRNTLDGFLEGMDKNPMNIYQFLDAKSIFEKEDLLSKLQAKAEQILKSYHPQNLPEVKKWLASTKIKLISAQKNKDQALIGFLTATVLWKVAEGLYLVNSQPLPPTTTAFKRLVQLKKVPANFSEIWNKILTGNLEERTDSTINLIDFVIKNP